MSIPTNMTPLRIGTAIAVLYSLIVVASSTPRFSDVPIVLIALYYIFVPGYVLLQYINEDYALIQRVAFSAIIGLALILLIFSLQQVLGLLSLPFDIVIPLLTILLVCLNYYRAGKPSLSRPQS